jgi:hypothetical protein
VLHVVVGHGDAGAAEGVGFGNVGAGLEVLAVNLLDDVGTGEREQVVVALQVVGEILEAFPAVVFLGEIVALNHRAHRPVEHQDAFFKQFGYVHVIS